MTPSQPFELATDFLARLAQEPAVLVQIESTKGSVPREAGTWMAVFANNLMGTIGGGRLEYDAIARARALLLLTGDDSPPSPQRLRVALCPALAQCCGGVVRLCLEYVSVRDLPVLSAKLPQALAHRLQAVALFGGGHVGHALVRVLANLPFALTWIDSRDSVFPASVPVNVLCEHSDPVQAAVRHLAPGSRVLTMSFSHAEDLEVVAACLQRQRKQTDLPYIGLIGSKTKWAVFRHRLEALGFSAAELAHVTSPIGVPGIAGKEPEVIAVAVAAQLLQTIDGH